MMFQLVVLLAMIVADTTQTDLSYDEIAPHAEEKSEFPVIHGCRNDTILCWYDPHHNISAQQFNSYESYNGYNWANIVIEDVLCVPQHVIDIFHYTTLSNRTLVYCSSKNRCRTNNISNITDIIMVSLSKPLDITTAVKSAIDNVLNESLGDIFSGVEKCINRSVQSSMICNDTLQQYTIFINELSIMLRDNVTSAAESCQKVSSEFSAFEPAVSRAVGQCETSISMNTDLSVAGLAICLVIVILQIMTIMIVTCRNSRGQRESTSVVTPSIPPAEVITANHCENNVDSDCWTDDN